MLPKITNENRKKKEIYKRIKLLGEGSFGYLILFPQNKVNFKGKLILQNANQIKN